MSFEARYFEPGEVRLRRLPTGTIELTVDGKRYPCVRLYSAYPLTSQKQLVSVRDALDENRSEIGIIREVSKLDPESRLIVEEELGRRYFTPIITRVISLKEEGIQQEWEVETDRGRHTFTVKDPYEYVRQIGDGALLITDTYERRYEIPDVTKLDPESRELLSRRIYF